MPSTVLSGVTEIVPSPVKVSTPLSNTAVSLSHEISKSLFDCVNKSATLAENVAVSLRSTQALKVTSPVASFALNSAISFSTAIISRLISS